jgi:glycosyltransferase 2 family protein
MNTGWKKWVSVIGAIVISGWFLWVTVHGINWARLLEILSGTKIGWVLVGSAAFTLSYAIKWWRWHLILKGLAPDIVPKQTLTPFFGGFALNNFLPLRAGEGYRVLSVSRNTGISKTSSLSTLMLDRIFDGLALVGCLAFAAPSTGSPDWVSQMLQIVTIIFLGGFALFFLLAHGSHLYERAEVLSHRLHISPVFHMFHSVVEALRIVKNPLNLILLATMSIIVWICEAVMYLTLAWSLSIPLTPVEALLILAVVNFGILIPSSPAYVGTFEFFTVRAMSLYAIGKYPALTFSLLIHTTQIILISLFGVVAWVGTNSTLKKGTT